VTDGWYDFVTAVFSPDGKYLYFVSERDFQAALAVNTEWNPRLYADMDRTIFGDAGQGHALSRSPRRATMSPAPSSRTSRLLAMGPLHPVPKHGRRAVPCCG